MLASTQPTEHQPPLPSHALTPNTVPSFTPPVKETNSKHSFWDLRSVFSFNPLSPWSSDLTMFQSYGGLVIRHTASFQWVCGRTELALLTSSQEVLLLLVQEPHWEPGGTVLHWGQSLKGIPSQGKGLHGGVGRYPAFSHHPRQSQAVSGGTEHLGGM